jgi:predicted amidophosphoribosyltransferase
VKNLQALQEIIFPSRCVGCRSLGLTICSDCRRDWHPHIYRQWSNDAQPIPIYSAVPYSPMAGKILFAAKENGIISADQLLVQAMAHSLKYFLQERGGDFFIPIPSRHSVTRKRGRQFVSFLSEELSALTGLAVAHNLIHVKKVKDQSSLDAIHRQQNINRSFQSKNYLSGRAIIIDDLVTTGATIRESVRALRGCGIAVAGAVTACFAEPLR